MPAVGNRAGERSRLCNARIPRVGGNALKGVPLFEVAERRAVNLVDVCIRAGLLPIPAAPKAVVQRADVIHPRQVALCPVVGTGDIVAIICGCGLKNRRKVARFSEIQLPVSNLNRRIAVPKIAACRNADMQICRREACPCYILKYIVVIPLTQIVYITLLHKFAGSRVLKFPVLNADSCKTLFIRTAYRHPKDWHSAVFARVCRINRRTGRFAAIFICVIHLDGYVAVLVDENRRLVFESKNRSGDMGIRIPKPAHINCFSAAHGLHRLHRAAFAGQRVVVFLIRVDEDVRAESDQPLLAVDQVGQHRASVVDQLLPIHIGELVRAEQTVCRLIQHLHAFAPASGRGKGKAVASPVFHVRKITFAVACVLAAQIGSVETVKGRHHLSFRRGQHFRLWKLHLSLSLYVIL